MSNPTISIIVPVYKVEPYLQQCADSILGQSFTDFELLLIDDGSPDHCGRICDDYASCDTRIRVFHQSNEGLSSARNTGLDNIKGRYVAMVDSDDVLLSNDYLKILYEASVRNGAEISICGHIFFNDGDALPEADVPCSLHSNEMDKAVVDGYVYCAGRDVPKGYSSYFAHGRLYKASLFNNLRYPVGRLYEDIAIDHLLTLHCSRIVFVNAFMYGYRVRTDSLNNGSNEEDIISDRTRAFLDRIDYFEREGYPELARHTEQILLAWVKHQLLGEKK